MLHSICSAGHADLTAASTGSGMSLWTQGDAAVCAGRLQEEEAAGRLPGGPGMRRCLKLLERMAAQNTQREIVMDFKVGHHSAPALHAGVAPANPGVR